MRKLGIISRWIFLCVALVASARVRAADASTTPTLVQVRESAQYLVFEFNNIPPAEARQNVEALRALLGPVKPESDRLYAFGMSEPMLLRQSVEELRDIVNTGFDVASELNVPVYFQLDDMNNFYAPYKGPETPFFKDPMMCEWSGWPAEGKTHGPMPRYWYRWGDWFCSQAIPCFASPKLREHALGQLRQGVLEPMAARLSQLHAEGRDYLFAGICVGWETHIPDYRPGQLPHRIDPDRPPVDRMADPPVTMQRWEMAQTGYASLYHYGYTQERLEAEAKERGISAEQRFREICHYIIHDYSALLAGAVFDCGVPRDRIFTHMVALDSVKPTESTAIPPLWAAVNEWSVPGFTLCRACGTHYDIQKIKETVEQLTGRSRFACAETYVRGAASEEQFWAFLREIFGQGGSMIDLFGWASKPTEAYYIPKAPEGATQAIIRWLGGEPLENNNGKHTNH